MVGKGAQAFKNVPVKQKADSSKNEKYLQETTSVHVFYGSNCKLEKAIQGKGLFDKNQKKAPLLRRGAGERALLIMMIIIIIVAMIITIVIPIIVTITPVRIMPVHSAFTIPYYAT